MEARNSPTKDSFPFSGDMYVLYKDERMPRTYILNSRCEGEEELYSHSPLYMRIAGEKREYIERATLLVKASV